MALSFTLPDGSTRTVTVTRLLNAGYAGRTPHEVEAHVAELAAIGVPVPTGTPTLYPLPPYLAAQVDIVAVQHDRTSGEAEWALMIDDSGDELMTVASDHTDRALERHSVGWSKGVGPDVLGRRAWRIAEIADHHDALELRAWVRHDVGAEETGLGTDGRVEERLVQEARLGSLLPLDYWRDVLRARSWLSPGTVLLSGTVPVISGVDPCAAGWRVELRDPVTMDRLSLGYSVDRLPDPIGDSIPVSKPSREEFEFSPVAQVPWLAVPDSPGVDERVLRRGDDRNLTRLTRWAAGTDTSDRGVVRHEFDEEVYLLEGELTDLSLGRTFTAGHFAARRPGMPHGPYRTKIGCVMFEIRSDGQV